MPMPKLFTDERREAVLTALRRDGRVQLARMADELDVTTETIRKDLIVLEQQGLLRRVRGGGAVPIDRLSHEPEVAARVGNRAEKDRIARAALAQLPDSGSILIDAGSTTARLVEILPGDRDLVVYTNTLTHALALLNRPRLEVVVLGGRLRSKTVATVDAWAIRALAEINVDVAFLGTNGLSVARGLTTPDLAEATAKRAMLATAQRRILLADHTKIGVVTGAQHAELSDIDLLITDADIDAGDLGALSTAGLETELA
ncbi:DeoR/GlpR family DNA-binding transcription regulator [Enemella evansiae]|uniref:DeoR/GlpR family DNA-binding transcription regulator n=1 Tax=Enemella evansiae TaxID=2016499 RepID=UPI001E5AF5D2|nr:DeoR/GlpR family DNA-binding transcription regulator [Enemella evansiae]